MSDCGAQLTFTIIRFPPFQRTCQQPMGHKGPHSDGRTTWTNISSRDFPPLHPSPSGPEEPR